MCAAERACPRTVQHALHKNDSVTQSRSTTEMNPKNQQQKPAVQALTNNKICKTCPAPGHHHRCWMQQHNPLTVRQHHPSYKATMQACMQSKGTHNWTCMYTCQQNAHCHHRRTMAKKADQMHCPCPSLTWPQVQVTHTPHQILSL